MGTANFEGSWAGFDAELADQAIAAGAIQATVALCRRDVTRQAGCNFLAVRGLPSLVDSAHLRVSNGMQCSNLTPDAGAPFLDGAVWDSAAWRPSEVAA